ncbi:hypothetical protein HDU93_000069 [Gonapodya sp. JEL0774]|nr:hypothetical protein HDU93_000069 [Gonapodya sp. JEL0774]
MAILKGLAREAVVVLELERMLSQFFSEQKEESRGFSENVLKPASYDILSRIEMHGRSLSQGDAERILDLFLTTNAVRSLPLKGSRNAKETRNGNVKLGKIQNEKPRDVDKPGRAFEDPTARNGSLEDEDEDEDPDWEVASQVSLVSLVSAPSSPARSAPPIPSLSVQRPSPVRLAPPASGAPRASQARQATAASAISELSHLRGWTPWGPSPQRSQSVGDGHWGTGIKPPTDFDQENLELESPDSLESLLPLFDPSESRAARRALLDGLVELRDRARERLAKEKKERDMSSGLGEHRHKDLQEGVPANNPQYSSTERPLRSHSDEMEPSLVLPLTAASGRLEHVEVGVKGAGDGADGKYLAHPSPSPTFLTATELSDDLLTFAEDLQPKQKSPCRFTVCTECRAKFKACLEHCLTKKDGNESTVGARSRPGERVCSPTPNKTCTDVRTDDATEPVPTSYPPFTLPLPPILPTVYSSSSPTKDPPFFRILPDPTPLPPPLDPTRSLRVVARAGVARVGGARTEWGRVIGAFKGGRPGGVGNAKRRTSDTESAATPMVSVPLVRTGASPPTIPAQSSPAPSVPSLPPALPQSDLLHLFNHFSSSPPTLSRAQQPRGPPTLLTHLKPLLSAQRSLQPTLRNRTAALHASSSLIVQLRARLLAAQAACAGAEESKEIEAGKLRKDVGRVAELYGKLVKAGVVAEEGRRQLQSRINAARAALQQANLLYVAADSRVGQLRLDAQHGSEVLKARAEATAEMGRKLEVELEKVQGEVSVTEGKIGKLEVELKDMIRRVDVAGSRRDQLRSARDAGTESLRIRTAELESTRSETMSLAKESARLSRDTKATQDALDVGVMDLKMKIDRAGTDLEAALAGKREGEIQAAKLAEEAVKVKERTAASRRAREVADDDLAQRVETHELRKQEAENREERMKEATAQSRKEAAVNDAQRKKFTHEADALHGDVEKQLTIANNVTTEHAALIKGTAEREKELGAEVDKVVAVTMRQTADREEVAKKLASVEGELREARRKFVEARTLAERSRLDLDDKVREREAELAEAQEDARYMARIKSGLEDDDWRLVAACADEKDQIAEYEIRVAVLTEQIAEQEAEKQRSSVAQDRLSAEISTLQDEILKTEVALAESSSAADTISCELADARQTSAAASEESGNRISALRLNVAEMGGRVVGLEVDRASLLRRIGRLEVDLETCRSELAKDMARSEKLRERIHNVRMASAEDSRIAAEFAALHWRVGTRNEMRTLENWGLVRWRERRGQALERTVVSEFRRMNEVCETLETAWEMWGRAKEELEWEERKLAAIGRPHFVDSDPAEDEEPLGEF